MKITSIVGIYMTYLLEKYSSALEESTWVRNYIIIGIQIVVDLPRVCEIFYRLNEVESDP